MSDTKSTAGWRLSVAGLALGVSLFTVAWFAAAALGSKFGLWGWQFGLGTMVLQWGKWLIFFALGLSVIGLIVASVINIFIASSALHFAITIIGVLIFAGLTAYDTQSIKNEYVQHAGHGDSEWLGKAAIMGALRLYLDFINMFMFLLQLLGNRE
mgnify:CR=1 FL=1